jgi:TrmH family RNA methyltransferase
MDPITSTQNRRVVEARKLDQRKHRDSQERFMLEGLQSLHMALDAGLQPLEVFYCEKLFTGTEAPALLQRCAQTSADLLPVSESVLAALSDRDTPQGLIAVFPLFQTRLEDLDLTGNELVVVLDRLQDPGNVGTLLRTADAVGAAAVILIEPCVDLFDPKVVRASMGSLFNLPVIRTPDVPHLFDILHSAGLRSVGADLARGSWDQDVWIGGSALVLGNEARGLSDDVRAYPQAWAKLPMFGKAESLNVSVAGGVFMYTWLRANRKE